MGVYGVAICLAHDIHCLRHKAALTICPNLSWLSRNENVRCSGDVFLVHSLTITQVRKEKSWDFAARQNFNFRSVLQLLWGIGQQVLIV
jgi:hypothetical protein